MTIQFLAHQIVSDPWPHWLAGTPPPSPPETYAALRTQLLTILQNLATQIPKTARTAFILATTKADIDAQVAHIRALDTSPQSAPTPPTLAAEAHRLAAALPIRGPIYCVSTACSSGLSALIDAACLLNDGDADFALVAGIDHASDFVREGFNSLKAISPAACRPFDKLRDGLAPNSGAAAILLTTSNHAHAPITLSGFALASDAVHMTAPDRHANGLIRAIQQALTSANLQPTDIHATLTHGTGTRYNDAMEATALQHIFSNTHPAITAVKGLIGHTMGASGLIEATLAARILETQIIPPITNLRDPEYNVDFVTIPRPTKISHILKLASGFGGLNAAIILSKP